MRYTKRMTEFLFIRHGEAANNTAPERIGGQRIDAPLTDKGRRQAQALGRYLRHHEIHPQAVFSSGAVRSDETARLALTEAAPSLDIKPDVRLLEMAQGDYENKLRAEVYTPETIARYNLTSLEGALPGGESIAEVQQRMRSFFEETAALYSEGIVLVFGHGLAIRALAGALRGFNKAQILAETTPNVSLTAIDSHTTPPAVRFVGKKVRAEYT